MRHSLQFSFAVAALAISATPAVAQYPYPYVPTAPTPATRYLRPPVLSPYLNLNNRGNPAVNYFNFVAPITQGALPLAPLPSLPEPILQPGDDIVLDPLDPTSRIPRSSAHPTVFGSTGAFFNSLGTIGSGLGRPAGGVAAPGSRTARR
jgi:hypothetical protein